MLLKAGLISQYKGPWGAPVVVVTNNDGSQRVCVDYSRHNAVTINDFYPCPNINETLPRFQGKNMFSTFDVRKAFHCRHKCPMDTVGSINVAAAPIVSGLSSRSPTQYTVFCDFVYSILHRSTHSVLCSLWRGDGDEHCAERDIVKDDVLTLSNPIKREMERERIYIPFVSLQFQLR